jgi:uncharacterized protein involved in exopolysaccharide biosynthesis
MGTEDRSRTVSLSEVLHVVFKRKRLVLTVFLLIAFGVLAGVLLIPRDFDGTATVILKRERGEIVVSPQQAAFASANLRMQMDQDLRSEAELLHRRSLLGYVVETLGPPAVIQGVLPSQGGPGERPTFFAHLLQVGKRGVSKVKEGVGTAIAKINFKEPMTPTEQAIQLLDLKLKVAAVDNSDVIKVAFTGSDRRFTQAVVSLLMQKYLDEYSRLRTSPGTVEFFQAESERLAKDLREAEDGMQRFSAFEGVTPLNRQREIYMSAAIDKEAALRATQSAVAELKEKNRLLRERLASEPDKIRVEEEWRENPGLQAMRAKLLDLETQREHLLQLYTPNDRRVQDIERETKALLERTAAESPWQRWRETFGENALKRPLLVDLIETEGQIVRHEVRAKSLAAEYSDLDTKLRKVDAALYERTRWDRKVHVIEDNYLLYTKKYQEARIAAAMDQNRIVNVTLAEPIQVTPKPGNAAVLSVLGATVGLVSGVGLAFVRESFTNVLDTDDSVRRAVGVPVVASIPDGRA